MKLTAKRNVAAGFATLLIACVAAVVWAQTGRARLQTDLDASIAASSSSGVSSGTAAHVRRPLEYYTATVRADMFGAEPVRMVETPVVPTPDAVPTIVAPEDPLVDYAYSGTVSFGDRVLALIENKKTLTGQYMAVGDAFLNGTVGRVDSGVVVVRLAGVDRTLAKTTDYPLTPLDKSASYLTAVEQQPAPGAPSAEGIANTPPGAPSEVNLGFPAFQAPDFGQQNGGQRWRGRFGPGGGGPGMGGFFGGGMMMRGAMRMQMIAQP